MKMTLSQVLAISGPNKPVYDARRRRGFMQWMDDFEAFYHRSSPDTHNYEVGRFRYDSNHAVLLALNEHLISGLNLSLEIADYVISSQPGTILEAINDGRIDPANSIEDFYVGVIRFADGKSIQPMAGTAKAIHAVLWDFQVLAAREKAGTGVDAPQNMTPASLCIANATDIYRAVRTKMLSGLKLTR